MSASLVGSEMCIRDRAQPGKGRLHPMAHRVATVPMHPNRCQRSHHTNSCLLYTSDAADDM
eukprot:2651730-Alexandrium_andersonii.AAC.1